MTTPEEETPVTLDGKLGSLENVEYYTPQEVGLKFRVDARTVVRWVKQGKFDEYNIQTVKTLGGHRRYNRKDVDRVFAELNPHLAEKQETKTEEVFDVSDELLAENDPSAVSEQLEVDKEESKLDDLV